MKLVAKYKGRLHRAEVIQTDEGLRYRLEDGREYKSPSAAGAAVFGPGRTCNGWAFWSIDTGQEPEPKQQPKARKKREAHICEEHGVVFETAEELEAHVNEEHRSPA